MGRQVFEPINASQSRASQPMPDELEQLQVSPGPDSSRIVMMHGDVTEQSTASVIAHLLYLANQCNKPIHLVISTCGGSVDEMFSIYDTIKFLPCPIYTIGLGKIMSAGVPLLASGTKSKRMIGRSSRIMIHPVSGGSSGNVFEQMAEVEEMKRLHDLLIDIFLSETKMTAKQLDKVMKSGHDFYLTPQQAIDYGIADLIIGG